MRTPRVLPALILSLLLASTAVAASPGTAGEPLAWTAVVPSPRPSLEPRSVDANGVIVDVRRPLRPLQPRPSVTVSTAARIVRVLASPSAGRSAVSGVASWYCLSGVSRCTRGYPSGLYAAIRRDLLGHRGDRARVCGNGHCVVVTVIDCNCGQRANLVDLYSDAFRHLAPLSRGRLAVTLTWMR